jgi:hypothetical protein
LHRARRVSKPKRAGWLHLVAFCAGFFMVKSGLGCFESMR